MLHLVLSEALQDLCQIDRGHRVMEVKLHEGDNPSHQSQVELLIAIKQCQKN